MTHPKNQYYVDKIEKDIKDGLKPSLLDILNMGINFRQMEEFFEKEYENVSGTR